MKQQAQRTAEEVIAPAIAWIKTLAAGAPFFAWVHLYDAHAPYDAPPPFSEKFRDRAYDGEVAYLDVAVGRLLATVREAGALDRTIVIAVGDHGEALGDHGEDEHGMFLYESVLRIPWIVRLPNAERGGSVVAEQVRSIDLAPTVLDLTALDARPRMDGESLAGVMRGRPRRDPPPSYADTHFPQLHFGWSMTRSLRVAEWKYIDAPNPELYDLRSDRAERQNVVAGRATVAQRMAADLDVTERSFGPAATRVVSQPDPETLARLRSLGYVGIAAPSARVGRGADPKDKIQEMKLFRTLLSRAIDDMTAKRTDAAIEKLKRAVTINERAYDVHLLLGDAWRQQGQHERALGEYDAAAVLNAGIAAPHVLAADLYLDRGMFKEAQERLQVAERLEPGSSEIASLRGRAHERSGRREEALAEYQRAVAINPSDVIAKTRLVSVAMNLKRFDVAEPQLRTLLALEHQPARTHYALGYIAEARGDAVAAAAEYQRAVAADPGLQQARDALARITKR
jgi:tetratricopeptide (TPR) repeat protein